MLPDSPRRSVLNSGVQGIPPMENGLVKDRLNRAIYVVIEPCCVMCSCISIRSFYRCVLNSGRGVFVTKINIVLRHSNCLLKCLPMTSIRSRQNYVNKA